MLFNFNHDFRILLIGYMLLSLVSTTAFAAEKRIFSVQSADPIGGASKVADNTASCGYLVSLAEPGQGVRFIGLPAANKLAIRYASAEVGTISVAVNEQPVRKVNVHSSGALTGSFLNVIIDIAIPAEAVLTISETPGDVWSGSFVGSSVTVIAPKKKGAGKIEIQIDDQTRAMADLSTAGAYQSQQKVCEVAGLSSGKHTINIINHGPGPVAVDAVVVEKTIQKGQRVFAYDVLSHMSKLFCRDDRGFTGQSWWC